MTTLFAEDSEHASYDREAVGRFWPALSWSDRTLQEFAGWFSGKTSPVHFFWHGFDLALTRFSGKPVSGPPASRLIRELSQASLELHAGLVGAGLDTGFERRGVLNFYESDAGFAAGRKEAEANAPVGMRPRILAGGDVRVLEPALGPRWPAPSSTRTRPIAIRSASCRRSGARPPKREPRSALGWRFLGLCNGALARPLPAPASPPLR